MEEGGGSRKMGREGREGRRQGERDKREGGTRCMEG